jgi:hypothetical protein
MPGETSLPVQHYADDFQILTVPFVSAAGVTDPNPILYADRDLVIDEIVVGITVIGGAAAVLNFRVSNNPAETAAASMCIINLDGAVPNVVANDTLIATTDNVLRYSSTGTLYTTAAGSTAINGVTAGVQSNLIPKGSWLVVDPTSATAARVIVQIRFRSRLK